LKEKQVTEKKITSTGLAISNIKKDISVKEKSIDISRKTISDLFFETYQQDQISLVEKLLSKKTLSEMSQEYNNNVLLNEKLHSTIKELANTRDNLVVSKNKKTTEEQSLKELKANLTVKQKAIEISKQEKDKLLAETKNKESNYKKILAEQQKKRDEFEKKLGEYEDQLKFILNPKLLPTTGTKTLSWPLKSVYMTQLFGKTSASGRLYKSGLHSGLDFKAPLGTEVKAMASGTVVGTGDTDIYCKRASFGKWIFIKHNNGLSTAYGHLSYIYVKEGQVVNTGDTIGLSGNTGHSTGPHLHITVYASQGAYVGKIPSLGCSGKSFIMPIAPTDSYLDPLLYLPKTTPAMIKK
jgi:murein DD-endopeptidase MepM/ murein hydrolase activator NlpD